MDLGEIILFAINALIMEPERVKIIHISLENVLKMVRYGKELKDTYYVVSIPAEENV